MLKFQFTRNCLIMPPLLIGVEPFFENIFKVESLSCELASRMDDLFTSPFADFAHHFTDFFVIYRDLSFRPFFQNNQMSQNLRLTE